jgi:poly-gamma-glutamate synthesis protein (capsule biosynthesis protein)
MQKLLRQVSKTEIPDSKDILSAQALSAHLASLGRVSPSIIFVGDIMLAGRSRRIVKERGPRYPFEAVLRLLRMSSIVVGNFEGPLTRRPRLPSTRNYSYRSNPELASSLKEAGINILALANNHLMDCGRKGVLDTLDALAHVELTPLGAGQDRGAAHSPVIRQIGGKLIGFLG